ncbi:hypothetical protein DRQ25_04755 [Candidatus Fermentibacteria bacterium]|nr:MAG: hypothetical protein DRQ25_04755 [Candidatus Fermentibacteria bacterium]
MANANTDLSTEISVLWILSLLVVLTGLSYLVVTGLHLNDLQVFGTAFVFLVLILVSISTFSLNLGHIPMGKTLNQSALFFMGGFFGWMMLLKSTTISSLTSKSILLEIVEHKLPPFWNWFLSCIAAPFAEESWFLLAMPLLMIYVMNKINEELNLNLSTSTTLFFVIIVSAIIFANFHVGVKAFTVFAVSAIMFRTTQLLFYWGDLKLGMLSKIDFIPSFALGIHVSNNINASLGYIQSLGLLLTHPLGIILLILFIIMLYMAINSLATIMLLPNERKKLLTST